MGTFVEYAEHEVRDFLENMGFKEIFPEGVSEMVYARATNVEPFVIVVFTSIAYGETRGKGKDAARVIIINDNTSKMVWSSKRVHRTKNFLPNIRLRCRLAFRAMGKRVKCPRCGGQLVIRENKVNGTEFYGCVDFPLCRGNKEIEEK